MIMLEVKHSSLPYSETLEGQAAEILVLLEEMVSTASEIEGGRRTPRVVAGPF